MFDLLRGVHDTLDRAAVSHALIGAGAMSVVGYVRATQDLDFLVVDPAVLEPAFWRSLSSPIVVEVFDGRMDGSDPLAGVVRLEDETTTEQVDVVVGKHTRWQAPILNRAMPVALSDTVTIPVVEGADLVLLKLFAGSPHDDNDIRMLLEAVPGLEKLVDDRIAGLAAREQKRWQRLGS